MSWVVWRQPRNKKSKGDYCCSDDGDILTFDTKDEAERAAKMWNYLAPQWKHTVKQMR